MTARVLVVDDIAPNVKLLEAKLTAEYFSVLTADSGPAALSLIESARPDIVLLDVMMPGMDGFEVCRQIKSDARTSHIPVVMVTALSDVGDRVQGLEAGADDFLTKPVDDIALFARVRSLVRLKMALDELRLREDTSEQLGALPGQKAAPTGDIAGARILLVEDRDVSAGRMAGTLEEAGCVIIRTDQGDLAPQLAAAENVDLVMSSLDLRAGDALWITSRLRSQEDTRTVPILLLIEDGDTERLAKGLEIGANDYLVRPVDRGELLARVRTQIRRKRYQERLRANYRESVSMAVTDSLTGLYNRRYFDVHIAGQQKRAADTGKPITLVMIDIDHFKAINDSYGHGPGDEVLVEIARRIVRFVRNFDMVARIGGEEFVVVMPDTDAKAALGVAQRLRAAVADKAVATPAKKGAIPVTVSIGVAVSADGSEEPSELLTRADRALYEAKRKGRNRVEMAEGPSGERTAVA